MTTALYRRYRPETFADVIGQEHVTEPLMQALRTGRVNHAYLFSGPRGCGKTTSARILARCLNCEQGPTPTPCGVCDSCVALARGGAGSVDVIEIDAASHGGVDDARDLRERASFGPASSRFKIYIIDEAHMVTPQGFNALLKIVEEPPEHVKFVFATTEPEKVIGTIRSRTHHYPFRLVPPKKLTDYMEQLLDAEGVATEPGVLSFVTRAGGGSVRDSLSVLDQLIAGSGPEGLTYSGAAGLLGFTDDELLDGIIEAFAAGDSAAVFRQIDRVIESGADPRRFVEDLLERLRDLIVVRAVAEGAGAVLRAVPEDQLERMRSQAASFGDGALSRAADVINAGLSEMTGATSPRLQLELMCARVLLPGIAGLDGYAARLDRMERRLDMGELPPRSPAGPVQHAPAVSPGGPAPVRPPSGAVSQAPSAAPSEGPRAQADQADRGAASRDDGARGSGEDRGGEAERQGQRAQAAARDDEAAGAPSGTSGGVDETEREQVQRQFEQSQRAGGPGWQGEQAQQASQPQQSQAPQQPTSASGGGRGGMSTDDIRRAWPDVLDRIFRIKRVTWTLLSQNAQVLEFDGARLVLGASSSGLAATMSRGQHPEVVRQALIEAIGVDVTVEARAMNGGAPQAQPQSEQPAEPWQSPSQGGGSQAQRGAAQWNSPSAGSDQGGQWNSPSQGEQWISPSDGAQARGQQPAPAEPPSSAPAQSQGKPGGWRERTGYQGSGTTGHVPVDPAQAGDPPAHGTPREAATPSQDAGLATAAARSSAWGSDSDGDWSSQAAPAPDWATGNDGPAQPSSTASATPSPAPEVDAGPADADEPTPDWMEEEPETDVEAVYDPLPPKSELGAGAAQETAGGEPSGDSASDEATPDGQAAAAADPQATGHLASPTPQPTQGAVDDGRTLTPRQRAEKAAREAAQKQEDARRVNGGSAYDDTSASIDDEDIENSDAVGLPVIKSVLGGTVIKEEGPDQGS
jgi:DNA polymerase-3 subunit gamma/tau